MQRTQPGSKQPTQTGDALKVSPENWSFLQQLHDRYLQDPASIPFEWQSFFQDLGDQQALKTPSWGVRLNGLADEGRAQPSKKTEMSKAATSNPAVHGESARILLGLSQLIRAYRVKGHFAAKLDPLGLEVREVPEALDPKAYGLQDQDLQQKIPLEGLLSTDGWLGKGEASPQEVIQFLQATYCGTLGVEFMYLHRTQEKVWLQDALETKTYEQHLTQDVKKQLWKDLLNADAFERFLAVKYPAAKRFGLEGGESLIPSLEQILSKAATYGVEQVVLGMAHRGRLNVLRNIMGLPDENFFAQFSGKTGSPEDVQGSGDVKYHLGASSTRAFEGRQMRLSLTANPSHLEAVNPVVLGKVRAKQDQLQDTERTKALGILIHGDAAFAGQGIVAESLMMCQLEGYRTGGTLHIVINNQIGFTTHPEHSRSSAYCTDLAKMVQAPILHVNGDDPEKVAIASWIAMDYIKRFQKDVVIDLVCYRRHGHNEIDEPSFTQPRMYQAIANQVPTEKLYGEKLVSANILSEADIEAERSAIQAKLQQAFEDAADYVPPKADWLEGNWAGFSAPSSEDILTPPETGVPESQLQELAHHLAQIPHSFALHPKLTRFLSQREEMAKGNAPIDWSTGEALAFGTLLQEGTPVRLSGQDVCRGTFTQRHAVFVDQETEESYTSLNTLKNQIAFFQCFNSPLSEAGVLGFELGYSLADPNALVLWEAQFGDFANSAQVIMDQFIAAGEAKWLRMSGLVMLLPHGYEGQGPEHSSARLERYLQLCAEDNLQVVNCSTPANYFHVLRRQIRRPFRKPLIVMTPKSLLRHKKAVSSLKEFGTHTGFQLVIPDNTLKAEQIQRLVLCSGKVYYDLLDAREKAGKEGTVALARLEQFYPFPEQILAEMIGELAPNTQVVWCQEEPANAGAWTFLDRRLQTLLQQQGKPEIIYAGRPAAAATATGFHSRHQEEQEALVREALG